jgi:hypothetical protein
VLALGLFSVHRGVRAIAPPQYEDEQPRRGRALPYKIERPPSPSPTAPDPPQQPPPHRKRGYAQVLVYASRTNP